MRLLKSLVFVFSVALILTYFVLKFYSLVHYVSKHVCIFYKTETCKFDFFYHLKSGLHGGRAPLTIFVHESKYNRYYITGIRFSHVIPNDLKNLITTDKPYLCRLFYFLKYIYCFSSIFCFLRCCNVTLLQQSFFTTSICQLLSL